MDAIINNPFRILGLKSTSSDKEIAKRVSDLLIYDRPEKIDPAILRTGRMDKVVYLGPPDFDARLALFKLFLRERPVDKDIDLNKLAELTKNYVSSDISFLVNEASRSALKERANISQKHFEDSINKFPPSVSERQLRKYEIFRNNRNFV